MRAWLIGGSGSPERDKITTAGRKKGPVPSFCSPLGSKRERILVQDWSRTGSLAELVRSLHGIWEERPTPTTSNAMQTSPHCWVQGSSANSRAFLYVCTIQYGFSGGLTHRKQRVTVCKERECVCVCVCVSEGVRRWGEGLAAEKLTEACQNGGEKKEGGGDWAENGSVPAQSLGWLGDRAAGWMGWDGRWIWKMDGIG